MLIVQRVKYLKIEVTPGRFFIGDYRTLSVTDSIRKNFEFFQYAILLLNSFN